MPVVYWISDKLISLQTHSSFVVEGKIAHQIIPLVYYSVYFVIRNLLSGSLAGTLHTKLDLKIGGRIIVTNWWF